MHQIATSFFFFLLNSSKFLAQLLSHLENGHDVIKCFFVHASILAASVLLVQIFSYNLRTLLKFQPLAYIKCTVLSHQSQSGIKLIYDGANILDFLWNQKMRINLPFYLLHCM